MRTLLAYALLVLVATASAQIDAGGVKSAVVTMTNHASVGAIVATTPQTIGSLAPRSGLIEPLHRRRSLRL